MIASLEDPAKLPSKMEGSRSDLGAIGQTFFCHGSTGWMIFRANEIASRYGEAAPVQFGEAP